MDKTRVDDMLIEMITPKVKEIEKKFSNNQALTQEDINTLLLKSQYNHINHLDMKLDEVTADVASLKGEFAGLKGEFAGLKGEFAGLKGEFAGLKGEFNTKFANLETKFEQAQVKMQETIISTMKWYIGGAGVILVLLKSLELFGK
ncbi:MAG: hypothetical protein U9R37_08475 [Campylobacterota bacterium]|nr:hypothetical protein [Campylobacterota bacterium]